MEKAVILNTKIEQFDFINFLDEIRENLSEIIEPSFIPMYMRPSNIEENVYVDIADEEFECLTSEYIQQDIMNNGRILYIPFIFDKSLCCEEGFICGDGSELDEEASYGDYINEDNGFIIETKDGNIKIRKATYGQANPFQSVSRIVNNAGDFEDIISSFVNKFAKAK